MINQVNTIFGATHAASLVPRRQNCQSNQTHVFIGTPTIEYAPLCHTQKALTQILHLTQKIKPKCIFFSKIAVILSIALLPMMIFAGEGEGFFERIWTLPAIFWQVLNVVLVIILFYYILKDKAPQFFRGRSKDIEKAWMDAVRDKEEAEKRLAEVEERMSHLNEEVRLIEETSKKEAGEMKVKMIESAKQEREILLKEGQRELDRYLREAKAEITKHASQVSGNLSREMLSKIVTKEDEENLLDKTLRSIEGEKVGKSG